MNKHRDISVDVLKCVAVLLIINSHADVCYPRFSALATGGAIGDALFLFCSGYTLFLGQFARFDNWYKKRIRRIYPSVFACLLVTACLGMLPLDSLSVQELLGGEFIMAIMVYYALLYVVQRWFLHSLSWSMMAIVVVTLVAYYFFPYKYEVSEKGIYGVTTLFCWIPYFGIMLMGAWTGLKASSDNVSATTWRDPLLMMGCLLFFYGVQLAAKLYACVAPWQILTIPALGGVVYYAWRSCKANCVKTLYNTRWAHWLIMAIGGVCLESYLIQSPLINNHLNWLFPLNIPIIMMEILVVAYVCRCLARIISQTFSEDDYNWKKVFAII